MADKSAVNTEKYQGPGRIVSSLGKGLVTGFTGLVAGSLFMTPVRSELNAYNLTKDMAAFSKKGKVLFGIATASIVVSSVYGLVKGWVDASKGKAQFEALKAETGAAAEQVVGLQTQVTGLTQEVGAANQKIKNYTEMHPSKAGEHGSFAADHAPKVNGSHAEDHASHADHGSKAAAAEASKLAGAGAHAL